MKIIVVSNNTALDIQVVWKYFLKGMSAFLAPIATGDSRCMLGNTRKRIE